MSGKEKMLVDQPTPPLHRPFITAGGLWRWMRGGGELGYGGAGGAAERDVGRATHAHHGAGRAPAESARAASARRPAHRRD